MAETARRKADNHGEVPPRGRGRPKVLSETARRKLVIDCTRRLMLKQGYATTTTDQIAAKCHISKQTLYGVFPDKISIFKAIIEEHRESTLALPGDYDDVPVDVALEKIFKAYIEAQPGDDGMAMLSLMLTESQRSPEIGQVIHEHGGEPAHAALARWIRKESKRGRIASHDPLGDAHILMDMIFGPIIRKSVTKFPLRDKYGKDHVRRCIGIFLNGVRRDA